MQNASTARTSSEKTWQITDHEGKQRTVTLADYRAYLDAMAARVQPVAEAFRRGDHDAMARAQAELRR